MNKKILFGVAAMGILGMVGAGVGLSNMGPAIEAKATVSTSFAVDSVMYIDLGTSGWDNDGYKIGIWNHGGADSGDDTVEVATLDPVSGLYKIDISVACTKFNIVRAASLTDGSHSWPNPTNQSDDVTVQAGKNKIIATGYDNGKLVYEWGYYDGGHDYSGDGIKQASIYLRTPNEKCNYYVYTFENTLEFEVNGFTIYASELTGSWNSVPVTKSTEIAYNPAGVSSDESSYGVIRATFNYINLNNVGVIITAIQHTGGSYSFQTKDLVVGASEDNQLELVPGAYYYGTDDWNLWDGFTFDVTNGTKMGADAEIALQVEEADICNLSKSQADDLRDTMDANNGYVTAARWDDKYTFAEAYRWVDSQCTNPQGASNSVHLSSASDTYNISSIVLTTVVVSMVALGGLFLLRKKRAE